MDKIQEFVHRIGEVAKAAVISGQVVTEATVLSKNPDGSLNVDDGLGGCARRAPKANVNIGDRIKIGGTEPSIGHTTDLPQVTHDCQGATLPCPTDDRRVEDAPKTLVVRAPPGDLAAVENVTTRVVDWADRETDQGTGSVTDCSTFIGYIRSFSGPTSFTPWSGYRREVVDACDPTVIYTCVRSFGRWDLASNDIPRKNISGMTLGISVDVTGSDTGQEQVRIYVVPATKGPPVARPFPVADRSKPLGSFRLSDATAFGNGNYGIVVNLDFSKLLVAGELPDPLFLCLMTQYDLSGTPPPQLHALIDNEDVTSHILAMFSSGASMRIAVTQPSLTI